MTSVRPYVKSSCVLNTKGTAADMTVTINTRHPLFWFDYIRTQLAYWIAPPFVLKEWEDDESCMTQRTP